LEEGTQKIGKGLPAPRLDRVGVLSVFLWYQDGRLLSEDGPDRVNRGVAAPRGLGRPRFERGKAAQLAAHESERTTRLDDRSDDPVTRDEIERVNYRSEY
jgi:hypothetical protein